MDKKLPGALLPKVLLCGLPLLCGTALAAQPVNLRHNSAMMSATLSPTASAIQEISRSVDFNKTLHVRVQQTYAGHPVWGADGVVHVPKGQKSGALPSLLGSKKTVSDGTMYQNLQDDLKNTPKTALSKKQEGRAFDHVLSTYQKEAGIKSSVQNKQSKLIVYVDKDNKARWAYQLSFYVPETRQNAMPALMNYVVDAVSFKVYAKWNDVKNLENKDKEDNKVYSGGNGGNEKMGMLTYDGLKDHLPKLGVVRDSETQKCSLQNKYVTVKKYMMRLFDNDVLSSPYIFPCVKLDSEHNDVYWTGSMGEVNGGYSPGNDALFSGQVIKQMYLDWYNAPVLVDRDGNPMMLTMIVHKPHYDNAYWDPSAATMTFGDGATMFYPLVSLGVAAHEVSHGFTSQKSNLRYWGQSGGMNEAFSDMAAQAAEFYAYGKNSWQIGPEIFKKANRALRYMDQPSKDCYGSEPGSWCSIDSADQYHDGLDVHYSSGVYNRLFYLMGTAEGWDVRKAFDVMVQANANYWTSNATFESGACGVINATKDYKYDLEPVLAAFKTVGIDTSDC